MSVDTVLHGGKVYTVNAQDSVAQAVAIRDGRIVAVGDSDAILDLAGPLTKRVNLSGSTVIPGFVDSHPHMDGLAYRMIKPAFGNPTSIDSVLSVIKSAVAKCKPGEWIVCNPIASEPEVAHYPKALREGRWPNRHDLDQVAPANPVYIEPPGLIAPGVAIANTAAIRIAGITPDTPVPPGIEIELDSAGELTGVFRDSNFPKLLPDTYGTVRPGRVLFGMIPATQHGDLVRGLDLAQKEFNACGITAIYEGHGIPKQQQAAYMDLWLQKKLSIRTYFVISFGPAMFHNQAAGDALIRETMLYAGGDGFGDDLLKFGGLGYSFDSATAIGACLMREPYVGARGVKWRGIQFTEDEVFLDGMRRAARAGLRVQVQAAGGAAIDKILGMMEEVDREIPINGKRWVIEHCQFPSAENLALCKRLGIAATTTTNFLWNYGDVYLRCFGEEMSADAIPLRDWIDAGVMIAQSTDGRPHNALFTLWQSLARKDATTGHVFGLPRQKLTRGEALRLYTYNAAYMAFWEDRIGSIETGKLADLAVLDGDIMTMPEERIPETKVLSTLLSGKPVHDTGMFGL
jgi:predicted amidohydrolase YtcJ